MIEARLLPNEYTQSMFKYSFEYLYKVILGEDFLSTVVSFVNSDVQEYEFSSAVHSYFSCVDIDKVSIEGLQGVKYLDKLVDPMNPIEKVEDREEIFVTGPIDSVYINTIEKGNDSSVLIKTGHENDLLLTSDGYKDHVVWNPWTSMEACYKEFVCVENANANLNIIKPKERIVSTMTVASVESK